VKAAKRQRQQSAVQPARQGEQLPPSRQGMTIVTGKSSAATLGVWAATKTITKAVFCVDNVHLACKEDDIRAHVVSLGVEVFSCFKTKPRRRPNEAPEDVQDRSAFRVSVNAAGRDRLLNPESWPDSVWIADWFFRDRSSQVNNEEKRRWVSLASTASPTRNNLQQAGKASNQLPLLLSQALQTWILLLPQMSMMSPANRSSRSSRIAL